MRASLSLLLVVSAFQACQAVLPICIFLGNCPKPNQDKKEPRHDEGPGALVLDSDWVEPASGAKGIAYHFGHNQRNMNWFDAYKYCQDKGGYLAEPTTHQEHVFIAAQARTYGNNKQWWLGARDGDNCQCEASGRLSLPAPGSSSFEAAFDEQSLLQRSDNRVRASCPNGYNLRCSGHTWKWSYSGLPLNHFEWNSGTGEPNGNAVENCISLWGNEGFRWSDWRCLTTIGKGSGFKPVCQKYKDEGADNYDYYNGDDDDDDDEYYNYEDYDGDYDENYDDKEPKEEDPGPQCVEENVAFTPKKNNAFYERLEKVSSWEECRRRCMLLRDCHYFHWRGSHKTKTCNLMEKVKENKEFRQSKNGDVSGSVSDFECTKDVSEILRDNPDTNRGAERDLCVEYGVRYGAGQALERIKDVKTPEDCRAKCLGLSGCTEWSWRRKGKKAGSTEYCWLKGPGSRVKVERKAAFTSGSVRGPCRNVELSDMQNCRCARPNQDPDIVDEILDAFEDEEEDFYDDEDDYYEYDDDLVSSGLIDVRIVPNKEGKSVKLLQCKKKQVRQCKPGQPGPREELVQQVACADFNTVYQGGGVFQRFNNVPSAVDCRARCLQNNQCKYWTWKGGNRRKQCLLIRKDKVKPAFQDKTTSGSIKGECSSVSLSQLRKCECITFTKKEDLEQEDDYEYRDLVSEGLIDVRISNTGSQLVQSCSSDQGMRCYAQDALPDLRSGLGDVFSRGNLGQLRQAPSRNEDAVIFGE